MPLDEPTCGGLDERRPRWSGVQIVQHHRVDAASKRTVIGQDIWLRAARTFVPVNRNLYEREIRDSLRLAVFKQPKIFLDQRRYEPTLFVRHERIDFDIFNLRSEG